MNHVEPSSTTIGSSPEALFERHDRHYIADLLVFRVERRLFRIPVNVLRDSPYFRDMLDAEHTGQPREGHSDDQPIVLQGITAKELESFLDVIFARVIDAPISLNLNQLSAALHLSTMWSFDSVRKYAIDRIESRFPAQNPFDRLDLAFKCDVDKWRLPAYTTICDREEPLSAAEGARLGFSRFATICRVREKGRPRTVSPKKKKNCGSCGNCRSGLPCLNPSSVINSQVQAWIQSESELPLTSSNA